MTSTQKKLPRAWLVVAALLAPVLASAQLEEVVVTGARVSKPEVPGSFLRRHGDFLLLNVTITNDTRDEKGRKDEIYRTLRNALTAAGRQKDVEIGVIGEDGLVYPLTLGNYEIDLDPGGRPDTSMASISVKTAILSTTTDGQALVKKLRDFVAGVSVVGRTQLEPVGDVQISVVDPSQYRAQIVQLFAEDARQVTSALGSEYRVTVEGIDRPVEWFRIGLLELGLYIPYTYTVIPQNVTSIVTSADY